MKSYVFPGQGAQKPGMGKDLYLCGNKKIYGYNMNTLKLTLVKVFPHTVRKLGLYRAEVWREYKEMKDKGKSLSFLRTNFNYFVYGASVSESLFFDFMSLNRKGKKRYITMRKNRKLDARFNNAESNKILWDKALFNSYFSPFIKRPYMFVDSSVGDMQLAEFQNIMGGGIAKPNDMYYGFGISKVSTLEELKALRDSGNSYIVEKLLSNCDELNIFNDSSLNTFRVVTCIDKENKVHVVTILLRTGCKGAIIDNLKGGGVCWHIDLNTGVIDCPGRDGDGNSYVTHPTSGVIGPGFRIPRFEELKSFAVALAEHLPGARYVGWDIAITPNGLEVIEGNACPSAELIQCNGVGLYNEIKSYL